MWNKCISNTGAVKHWIEKYRTAVAYSASSAAEFEEKYGEVALTLVAQHDTAYKLTRALRMLDPPVSITDQVAKTWLAKFRGMRRIMVPAQVFLSYSKF
jgi:hypothetical protein